MITPLELSINWYFTAVPVFDWEPLPLPPCKPPEADAKAEPPPAADAPDAGGAAADTASTPAERRRLVLVRYEWRPAMDWEYVMNPEWNRWVDRKQDDADDHSRDNERARNTRARPLPQPAKATFDPAARLPSPAAGPRAADAAE